MCVFVCVLQKPNCFPKKNPLGFFFSMMENKQYKK